MIVAPDYRPSNDNDGEQAPDTMRIADRQVLSLLHRILARVLPEDSNDGDGDEAYQLQRAEVIEKGFTGEYRREVAGFRTELSKLDCDRLLDILDMLRVITYSIARLAKKKPRSAKTRNTSWKARGSTTRTSSKATWPLTSTS